MSIFSMQFVPIVTCCPGADSLTLIYKCFPVIYGCISDPRSCLESRVMLWWSADALAWGLRLILFDCSWYI